MTAKTAITTPYTLDFAERVLAWGEHHGRQGLPWQPIDGRANPYFVWLSEVMLQQTQVATVRLAFERFVERFPTVQALAAADLAEVLGQWSGLGYYARARNLHRAAQLLCAQGGPAWPGSAAEWEALPGIGRSTAAALASVVLGQREAILDGNLKRLLARHTGCDQPWGSEAMARELWPVAEARLPGPGPGLHRRMQLYTQSMMDLGAMVCTPRRPQCEACPLASDCVALSQNRVGELPRPKQARARASMALSWALCADAGGVWLVRNPARGIWGGLWVLPSAEALGAGPGATADAVEPWLRVQHDLTHRRLEISVRWVNEEPSLRAGPDCRRWAWTEVLGLGIPTPVRSLLLKAAGDLRISPGG